MGSSGLLKIGYVKPHKWHIMFMVLMLNGEYLNDYLNPEEDGDGMMLW